MSKELNAGYDFTKNQIAELEFLRWQVAKFKELLTEAYWHVLESDAILANEIRSYIAQRTELPTAEGIRTSFCDSITTI